MISRRNYETYLMDYLDNALSAAARAEVEQFLLANPDIAHEMQGVAETRVLPDSEHYSGKKGLKKARYHELGVSTEADYLCVAELEGDITKQEAERLNELATADVEVAALRRIYPRTKITPTLVAYPHKKKLKKTSIAIIPIAMRRVGVAAASVAAIWGLFQLRDLIQDSNQTQSQIATITKTEPSATSNNSADNIATKVADMPLSFNGNRQHKVQAAGIMEEASPTPHEAGATAPNEQVALVMLARIEAAVESVHGMEIEPMDVDRICAALVEQVPVPQHIAYEHKVHGSTREYTLADVALGGARLLGRALGFKSEVHRNSHGKVTRVEFESSLIAFSSTNNKNKEN